MQRYDRKYTKLYSDVNLGDFSMPLRRSLRGRLWMRAVRAPEIPTCLPASLGPLWSTVQLLCSTMDASSGVSVCGERKEPDESFQQACLPYSFFFLREGNKQPRESVS
jgi:hypothetical protein